LVIGIEPAHLETRMAVILRRGGNAAQAMTSAALVSLIEARAPDMHQAVALADHLAQHGEFPQTGVVGFDRILATVADRCQLRPGDLTGKRRDRETSVARGLALLLGRRLTDHSLQALGGMVGGRDHATVLHSLRTTEERIATDPAIRQLYEELARSVVT
jgi:chromosomal replication initiator protein